jgi:hypothetical protein
MVVVPIVSSVAAAVPLLPLMVATAGLEDVQPTGPSTISPFTDAVNCRVELLSCRGLFGEMVSLLVAEQTDTKMSSKPTIKAAGSRFGCGPSGDPVMLFSCGSRDWLSAVKEGPAIRAVLIAKCGTGDTGCQ